MALRPVGQNRRIDISPDGTLCLRFDHSLEFAIDVPDPMTAVEVKSAATVASDFFSALSRLGRVVGEGQPHLTFDARVVYAGESAQHRSDATVIPWQQLHEYAW